jgi:hypothetical protein
VTRLRPLLLVAVVASVAFAAPRVAHAKKQADHRYRFEQVWSAAIRMVRVDLRFPVQDQDPATGFMLFDWVEHNRQYPGSIELVRTDVDGVPHVRVVVQVPSMPSYVEQMLLDRLARKLTDEFGEPPPSPPPARPEPPPAERPGDDEDDDRGGRSPRDGDRPRGDRRPTRRDGDRRPPQR